MEENIEEIISNTLKNIGLNSYERQIYAFLIKQGCATSSQITSSTKVPRSRTYDILESLEIKGFTKILPTKPKKFTALHPNDVVENIKSNIESEYMSKINKIDNFSRSNEIKFLANSYDAKSNKEEKEPVFCNIKDKFDFKKTFDSMIKSSKNEICIITTETGMANMTDYFQSFKTAALRGIKIRIVAPITNKNINTTKKLAEVGLIKNITSSDKINSNGTMILIDDKESIISVSDENVFSSKSPLLRMKSNHFSRNFAKTHFDLTWSHLDTIDEKLYDNN